MSNILKVASSALNAAQVGLTVTGHNIANANTPGYNRQIVTQGTGIAQNMGFGFLGKGTQINSVQRVYDEYLASRVLSAQSSASEMNSYSTQIRQINNMLADSSVGLSPSMQEFFKGVQTLAAGPNSNAARQSMLSSAEMLSGQFKTVDGQLRDIREGVNNQIITSIDTINGYASQLAKLNDSIDKAMTGNANSVPNDLLDQRDQVVAELSKQIKVSVIPQGSTYNVFIGNGQPLVVSTKAFELVPTQSSVDPSRMQVGFLNNGRTIPLAESVIAGGSLGGLFAFRNETLDPAQNALGRMAIALASDFNAQHQLGQDKNGNVGGKLFTVAEPLKLVNSSNAGTGLVDADITDTKALTGSDYRVQWNADTSQYDVTRVSDNKVTSSAFPVEIDGVLFRASGTPQGGDSFLIRPTANGASEFNVAIKDTSKIAAAAPVRTLAGSMVGGVIVNNNTGTGKVSAGSVTSTTLMPGAMTLTYAAAVPPATSGTLSGIPSQYPVTIRNGATTTNFPAGATIPYQDGDQVSFGGVTVSGIPEVAGPYAVGPATATITFDSATGTFSGFPPYVDVTVTNGTVSNTYPAGTPVPYTDGATISFGGQSMAISGTLANNDQFTVAPNTNGAGDNRNALAMGTLQSARTMEGGSISYQSAFGQLVSTIGNKAHELEVTGTTEARLLDQMVSLQQADSGVNLDEEATNLLRYQQAYTAAGKVMATASKLFDMLLSITN